MQLRSGTTVGKLAIDAVDDMATNAAATLASLSDDGNGSPITCSKEMGDRMNPLMKELGNITGENRVLRKMFPILKAFRTLNRCDMDHMIRAKPRNASSNPTSIARFALTVLHKACELTYDIVDHLVRNHPDYGTQEKQIFITALTELARTKWNTENTIRRWIASADAPIGTALLNACASTPKGVHDLISIYQCVVNNVLFAGPPPYSMDDDSNDGWTEAEVFDHCFANPNFRGFVWANCTREYQVYILGNSGAEVFGKRNWEVMEDSFSDMYRLEDDNHELQQKIDANDWEINDYMLWMDGMV